MNLSKLEVLHRNEPVARRTGFLRKLALAMLILTMAMPVSAAFAETHRTDWFSRAGYGIMVHWTSLTLPESGKAEDAVDYETAVNNFDVDAFADQLEEAGAEYVIFTISHKQMYFAFPNAALDNVLPGRTHPTRDLYMDLYDELAPRGIKMMFYYPNIGTPQDPDWKDASGWGVDDAAFAELQYDILEEVGLHYGNKLAGWWIDCLHEKDGWDYDVKYGNFAALTAALKAGNAERLVSYNFTGPWGWNSAKPSGIQDFAAGEQIGLTRYPTSRFSGETGAQWHTAVNMDYDDVPWFYNGTNGKPSLNHTNQQVIQYMRGVMLKQGVFSYNGIIYQEGHIDENTMDQLRVLKRAFREVKENGEKRVDNPSTGIDYVGSWSNTTQTGNYNDTIAYSSTANDYATFDFNGTSVKLYTKKGPGAGIFNVYLDGVLVQAYDAYSATGVYQSLAYSNTALSAGPHTIKVEVTGTKNASATGYNVHLDEISYSGNGILDDHDDAITYGSSWSSVSQAGNSGGTVSYSNTANSYAEYKFYGTSVGLYTKKGPGGGIFDVYLDGTKVATYDSYSATGVYQTLAYQSTSLGYGPHTLKMVITGTKNPSSTNTYGHLDYLTITN